MGVKRYCNGRVVMTLEEIRREASMDYEEAKKLGICGLVEVENMGWCKDDVTRWYTFTNADGMPAIYFKY